MKEIYYNLPLKTSNQRFELTPLNFLKFKNLPILEQLRLEEALLRTSDENWCLLNEGSSPAIVMGISGKPQELLDIPSVLHHNIPVIKRYSGGGTVLVDQNTLFVSFIINRDAFPIAPYPRTIMEWSSQFYAPLFPAFSLRENDYVIENRKFGGNAQYITKNRWVHHSTLLWDYDPSKMSLLKLPPKRPSYREDRDHRDFLCPLKHHQPSISQFIHSLVSQLNKTFVLTQFSNFYFTKYLEATHRKNTVLINFEKYKTN